MHALAFLWEQKVFERFKNLDLFIQSSEGSLLSSEIRNHLKKQHLQLESYLSHQIKQMAARQYYVMNEKQDFGELGAERVEMGFCRVFFQIPADQDLDYGQMQRFEMQMQRYRKAYAKIRLEKLQLLDEARVCHIFDRKLEWFKDREINQVLEFLGSSYRLIVGFLGVFRSILYGPVSERFLDEYRVTEFLKEEARTPAAVLSIAAVVGGKHVAIRHESCDLIYQNKWKDADTWPGMDEESSLGDQIKQKALSLYELETGKDYKNLFMQEMHEGLIWHEIGHGIVLNSLVLPHESAFGEAMAVWGNNIISVMKEFFADWAPKRPDALNPELAKIKFQIQKLEDKDDWRELLPDSEFKEYRQAYLKEKQWLAEDSLHLRGPLRYMTNLALEGKRQKALRMLMVYLSDNWFLGGSHHSFYNQSDCLIGLLLPYLKEAGDFDFERLDQDLPRIFHEILTEYLAQVRQFEALVKQLPGFAAMAELARKKVHARESGLKENQMDFLVPFYAEILQDLPQGDSSSYHQIQTQIEALNQKFHQHYFGDLSVRAQILTKVKKWIEV